MKTKNILWGILTLVTIVLFSGFLNGPQNGFGSALQRSPETRANIITTIIKNKLSLDEAQSEKAYSINLKYAQKLQPFISEATLLQGPNEETAKINADRKKELLAILTPDQLKQVNEIRRQWIGRLEKILERLKENDLINN